MESRAASVEFVDSSTTSNDYKRLPNTGSDESISSGGGTPSLGVPPGSMMQGSGIGAMVAPKSPKLIRVASMEGGKGGPGGPGSINYSYQPSGSSLWFEGTIPIESTEQGNAPTITLQDLGIIPAQRLEDNAHGRVRYLALLIPLLILLNNVKVI